ncbi:phage holin family protein [Pseudacidovorax intermedius]|uniref:phage holin family protein n=1 Tax=Pseudacidovorax intermedius TaxID=433924 RepID=UPI0026EE9984|nr:phage holin family protein [Pseudacidovorax intermedius]
MSRLLDMLGLGPRLRRWKAAGAEAALGVHDRAQLAGLAWQDARAPLAQSALLSALLALVSVVVGVVLSAAVVVHYWDGPFRVRAAWGVALGWAVVWVVLLALLLARVRQTSQAVHPLAQELRRDLSGGADLEAPSAPPDPVQVAAMREEVLARIAEQRARRALLQERRAAAEAEAAARAAAQPPTQPLSATAMRMAREHPIATGAAAAAVVAVLGPRRLVRWAGWALPILWKLR